ncbi:MAG TPA: thioredoxin domain-containing protein [Armatimonadota bacterium]|jgi:hypothetical protein
MSTADTQSPIRRGENLLAKESSAYLRSAAHQPVWWRPWGPEAFREAQELDLPMLLDIGAVWCHWCHVMDGESYEDPAVAKLINERFVAVKVDRDQRMDVDRRYQEAVGALCGQGGWPLTGFLTPGGKVFYGGTYFPPRAAYGRPSFPQVLQQVSDYYAAHRDEALASADHLNGEILRHLAQSHAADALSPASLETALRSLREQFDSVNGGFGSAPKFPHASAMDLLIARCAEAPETWMREVIETTLTRMGEGGVYDQVGGGFHRYSTDERWIVPHFEKMLYDNAELLGNYVLGFRLTGNPLFRQVALGIVRWVDEVLCDRQHGGFYASQDADINLEDDGDYFTWTAAEAREELSPEEMAVVERYYDLGERGEMHHNPAKNVLYVAMAQAEVARTLGLAEEKVGRLLESARAKLARARGRRPTPFVDATFYTNWNGMMVTAYLQAGRELELEDCVAFALKTLDRLLDGQYSPGLGFAHAEGVPGLLDDQAQMARALLEAYEVTGQGRYLDLAREVLDALLSAYWDSEAGGFFDRPSDTGEALGMLEGRHKPIQDSPSSSANAVAAYALDRLHYLTGEARYREAAEKTLLAFAGITDSLGLFAASYFAALDHHMSKPLQVVVAGDPDRPDTRELAEAARRGFRPRKILLNLEPEAEAPGLSEALGSMLEGADALAGQAVAYVCAGDRCGPPTRRPAELEHLIRTFGTR